ncbi:MAG: hypothetical protein M0P91_00085 [Sulfuricurvum sp.]|uniref:hypothetical protein n=1 Tax=Sulfuricurvum sp. TaxID=2025608 RepID=UPI0025D7FF0E|nr:hypothetical protein [Sulfuricurvum sp.]MCK9371572.1 hypothetical protein [Sulfuricurvum sp.]
MRRILITLLMFYSASATEVLYWFDEDRKKYVKREYFDAKLDAYVYSSSHTSSKKMILTQGVVICFLDTPSEFILKEIETAYSLALIKKIDIGTTYYLFKVGDKEKSLSVANEIKKDKRIRYAYPDWQIIF